MDPISIAMLIIALIRAIPDIIELVQAIIALIKKLPSLDERRTARRAFRRTVLDHASLVVSVGGRAEVQFASDQDKASLRTALQAMHDDLYARVG